MPNASFNIYVMSSRNKMWISRSYDMFPNAS